MNETLSCFEVTFRRAALTSPEGTIVTLTTDNGAGNDNVYDGALFG